MGRIKTANITEIRRSVLQRAADPKMILFINQILISNLIKNFVIAV
jgi:hypothetical protein